MSVLFLLFLWGVFPEGAKTVIQTQQTVLAAVGEEARLSCCLVQPKDVLQVTWQVILPDEEKNFGTYNKYFGQRVTSDFRDKVDIKSEGLQNSSVVIKKVTEQDEGCYRCLFNTYPEGALSATTCLKLYELHDPVLHVRESDFPEQSVVSCSATGRPAPTVTLSVSQPDLYFSHYDTVGVTNSNTTVSVTTTAVLSGFHDGNIQVGCAVRVLSGPQKEVFVVIPKLKHTSADGAKTVIQTQQTVLAAVGEEARLSCCLVQPKDVLQVTWQVILPDEEKNFGTYNKYFGQRVTSDFRDKVDIKSAGLQNSSVVIKKVTEQDEGCYRCLFNTYPEGALSATTCLKLYELHEPVLHVRESDSPGKLVVSCSATGRPAPTVTLSVSQPDLYFSHYDTVGVTNSNTTISVTTTAVLSGFHDSNIQVGCAVRVHSGPQKEVFVVIPKPKQASADAFKEDLGSNSSGDNFTWIIVFCSLVTVTFVVVVLVICLLQKQKDRSSDPEKSPHRMVQVTMDTHGIVTPLMKKVTENVHKRSSAKKPSKHVRPKSSVLVPKCLLKQYNNN
ncbi:hypothetical protein Q5P01_004832 [Channa striata]|uniref:Ig-like domain-containing protein n=1 Tax=Channa striata TaxID=64152 RepID=A0AA88NCJ6_CHASR|nr:hypothetical protein Q5P01_004832 [Channa striata]